MQCKCLFPNLLNKKAQRIFNIFNSNSLLKKIPFVLERLLVKNKRPRKQYKANTLKWSIPTGKVIHLGGHLPQIVFRISHPYCGKSLEIATDALIWSSTIWLRGFVNWTDCTFITERRIESSISHQVYKNYLNTNNQIILLQHVFDCYLIQTGL